MTTLSPETVGSFFAYAPLVLGLIIFFAIWGAKRNEKPAAANATHTYACATCGKRGARDHMVPMAHEGAVGYYCANCARG